ncbi:MAG: tryptophan synthase subunit alpha [Candidatus Omnitrophota bacterium]
MNRIDKKFRELRRAHKKAFIAFITAGYPNLQTTRKLILEFAKKGVDIIELGVPFSDPLADGPIIQEASQKSLERNTHLIDILRLVKGVRHSVDIPLCLMTYFNPVFCFGEKKFIDQAASCGVDGLILPDLTPEEGISFARYARKKELNIIYFLSPTSTPKRMKYISGISRGFIYYVSLTGVTGARKDLPTDIIQKIRAIKKITAKSVCVGFGVSRPEQVRQIQKFADGVIVGSAIIQKIKQHIQDPRLVQKVSQFVSYLKS